MRNVARLLFAVLVVLAVLVFPAKPSASDPCTESFYDGTCWYYHDLCSGWCTWACPWGDSQGPC
ncbi:MAG TPA: hypothetical protein VEW48_27435 [Thermoanaerobaculia bacterium]|nr:hypothetical protein [Thermoanaerobaculia bacterium]